MIMLFIFIVVLLISQAAQVGQSAVATAETVSKSLETEIDTDTINERVAYCKLEYEVPRQAETAKIEETETTEEVVTTEPVAEPEPIVLGAYTEVIPEEPAEPETVEETVYEPAEVTYEGYIPGDTGFRSYEPYTAIGHGSIQEIILWYAAPDENGLMSINGRPLVAIGTGWGYWLYDEITVYTDEGSYDCIVGDIKADVHTDWTNRVTAANGCVVEFIVDPWAMDPAVKGTGSISAIPKYHGYVTNIVKTGEVSLG